MIQVWKGSVKTHDCTFQNRIKIDLACGTLQISNPFPRDFVTKYPLGNFPSYVLFCFLLACFVLIFVLLTFDTFNQVRVAAYR